MNSDRVKIHHVGYAVWNIEEAALAVKSLGYCEEGRIIKDKGMKVDVAFFSKGNGRLELVAPYGEPSPVDGYLKRNGSTPYHIGYLTDDIDREVQRLEAEGWKLIRGKAPAAAFQGSQVAFLFHRSFGVIELIEEIAGPPRSFYTVYMKRVFDLCFGIAFIVILAPLFLILFILGFIFLGRPVIYSTIRAGKDGMPFTMYKFRSMTEERDADGELLPERKRLTRYGRLIRRTSFDELPQLFNIVKGDMSFIGPRPLAVRCVPNYSQRYRARLSIRPGLACFPLKKTPDDDPWTYRRQFENDISYVRNMSFWYDIQMVFAVLRHVITDTYERENALRPEFDGTNLDRK